MVAFFDGLVDFLKTIIAGVVGLLPKSPFIFDSSGEFAQIMGYVNYFIPINRMVQIMETWLVAVGVWYLVMAILRWVKVIE